MKKVRISKENNEFIVNWKCKIDLDLEFENCALDKQQLIEELKLAVKDNTYNSVKEFMNIITDHLENQK